jgi:thiamine pyrophosphokinase
MRAVLLGPVLQSKLEAKTALASLALSEKDMRVGVDGGTEYFVKLGLLPHIAVGDWDSLKTQAKTQAILKKIPHITLPTHKDRSDLFYAARAAVKLGASEIVCAGVTGGRLDQQLGVLYDLAGVAGGAAGRVKSVSVFCTGMGGVTYYFLSPKIKKWSCQLKLGQIVSLFPLGGSARGVSTRGLKYRLKNAVLTCDSRGLSNRVTQPYVEVKLTSGHLVAMIPE